MAGGALAAGGTLWYILKEDGPDNNNQKSETTKVDVRSVTEDQLEQILNAMLKSQELWRNTMKTITAEATKSKLSLKDVYRRVQADEAEDALEQHGITMEEFDQMLEKHRSSTKIRDRISHLMGGAPRTENQSSANSLTAEFVVEVHTYMAQCFHDMLDQVHEIKSQTSGLDMKAMALALQIYVAAKVDEKYNASSDDIEVAVMTHQHELSMNPEFRKANADMQCMMNKVFGSQVESTFAA